MAVSVSRKLKGSTLTGKWIWYVFLTAVLLTGVYFAWPRAQHRAYPPEIEKWLLNLRQNHAQLMMEGVEYTNNVEGKDLWVMNASRARYFKEGQEVHLDQVKTRFFLKDGQLVTVSGEHAIYDTRSKDIKLWGHVSAITSDQRRFFTDAALYNDKERLISTPEKVIIVGSQMDLKGQGLTYDLATGKMSILSDVQVITQKALR